MLTNYPRTLLSGTIYLVWMIGSTVTLSVNADTTGSFSICEDGVGQDGCQLEGFEPESGTQKDIEYKAADIVYINSSLRVSKSGRVVNLIVPPEDYDGLANGGLGPRRYDVLQSITRKLYSYYKDDFDFIVISNSQPEKAPNVSWGTYYRVKNDTQGLGMALFDYTAQWTPKAEGANPYRRLQGVVHFPYLDGIYYGPGLHELMHRWGNYCFHNTGYSTHWGFSNIGGQLGGFKDSTLVALGGDKYQANMGGRRRSFGLFVNGGNSVPYGDFELYLMGMLPLSSLHTIKIAEDASWVDQNNGIFSTPNMQSINQSQLVSQLGNRIPTYSASQRHFKVLNVVISKQPMDLASTKRMDDFAYKFSAQKSINDGFWEIYNFWEATQGKGSLQMDLGLSSLKNTNDPEPNSDSSFIPAVKMLLDDKTKPKKSD